MMNIIFDLDGTLIDSIPGHRKLIQEIANRHGFSITEKEFSQVNGMTPKEGLRRVLEHKQVKIDLLALLKERRYAMKKIYDYIQLYPDTIRTLKKLSQHQLAVATSSNKTYLQRILKQFDLERYFSVKLSANDVKHAKPHPDIFLQTAKRLGASPEECVVVEDSVNGIIAGNQAGMKTICLLSTTPQEAFVGEAQADAYIHVLSELPELLKRIQG